MSSFKLRMALAAGLLIVGGGIGFGAYRMSADASVAKAPVKTAAAPADTAVKADAASGGKAPLWGKACDAGTDGKQTCVITQNVIITDKTTNASLRALSVSVGYLPGQSGLRMALTLPLGVKLPPGVGFQIDDGQASTLPVETCLADGCRIFMTIDSGGRDSMVKSKLIRVSYELANGQKMALPIELAGFGDALSQLTPTP
jgi:invasion protein IalB